MSYNEKRKALKSVIDQGNDAVMAIAQLQNLDNVATEIDTKLDEIIANGSFDTVDTVIKTPAIAARAALKALRTALDNEAIREMLDWRPGMVDPVVVEEE